MKAQVCKTGAALIAALALTLFAQALLADDGGRPPDAACTASDANDIATKLGFPANPLVQSPEEGSCAITFKSIAHAGLQLDFVHFSKASDASQEFHADVEPGAEKIPDLGDEALLESGGDSQKWTRRLTALKGDATVDVIYEGDPAPVGGEKTKAELIAIAGALLGVAAKAPVSTMEEPKCDKPGESDACPIEVDFPDGQGPGSRVFTGTIGKIPIWSYSAPAAAGQTIAIRFKGPRGMLGEVDCPGAEGGAPSALQNSATAKIAGECLVSVGIDFGEAHGTGPYTLTIERK
jgi:hypothetical protein